jgi:hypothetical protein
VSYYETALLILFSVVTAYSILYAGHQKSKYTQQEYKKVVFYECETWPKTEKDKNILKLLQKVFGPVSEQGIWRIRANQERGNLSL